MDPYVCIEYRNKKYKTDVDEEGGRIPVWNNTISITVYSLEDDVKITCFDEDLITDDFVGSTIIKVGKLV